MTPDHDRLLREASPMFYGNLGYFECGDGWFEILMTLGRRIDLYQRAGRIHEPVEAVQVKEKFGWLRVYFSPYNGLVDGIVQEAHEQSWTVCETCGKAGEQRRIGGWLLTRCDVHYDEERKRSYA